jgi:hypothetical protein
MTAKGQDTRSRTSASCPWTHACQHQRETTRSNPRRRGGRQTSRTSTSTRSQPKSSPTAGRPRAVPVTLGLQLHSVAVLGRGGRVSAARRIRKRVFYSQNKIAVERGKRVLTPLSQLRQASNHLVWSLTTHSYQTSMNNCLVWHPTSILGSRLRVASNSPINYRYQNVPPYWVNHGRRPQQSLSRPYH